MTQPSADPATLFRVLADPTRRAIVELLGNGPRRAGEISTALDMSPPALSRHLRVLLDAGLVVDGRTPDDARGRVFQLRPHSMLGLRNWLDEQDSLARRADGKKRCGRSTRGSTHGAQTDPRSGKACSADRLAQP